MNIVIYQKPNCPYCVQAKNLLYQKKVTKFQEIDISVDEKLKEEMLLKSGGRRTVPQIFINDKHIGGYDDLYACNQSGELDELLAIK